MAAKHEGRYYVEYLGWKESRGLFGREFTEPVVKELLARRRESQLPRMTIKVNDREIQISQEVTKRSGSRGDDTQYPGIPVKDTSFVTQSLYPDSDVVACIFLGYNPYTKCAIHVHAYRFDSEATASLFVGHVNSIIGKVELRERIMDIEKDLVAIGHVVMRQQREPVSRNSDISHGGSSHSSGSLSPQYPTAGQALKQRQDIKRTKSQRSTKPDKDVKRIFTSLQEELEYKMKLGDAPILLPPKDYDTIVRRHGKLGIREELKSSIIGPDSIFYPQTPEPNNNHLSHTADKVVLRNGQSRPHTLVRSQSDTFTTNGRPSSLHRQNSQASSDRSNNSDDNFADGVYQGYRPRKHSRSKSKDNGKLQEDGADMAMWSPSFSFGQTGMKHLPTHLEEESDQLNKSSPAKMLTRQSPSIPVADYNGYQITQTGGRPPIQRSNSQKQPGEFIKRKYK